MLAARILQITAELVVLVLGALRERFRSPADAARLPRRLRESLERLGPTFVKLGQALSLRRDLLSDEYVAALRDLQDRVSPFPGDEAVHEIETALCKRLDDIFAAFEREPFAAASIAQVHRARLHDGRWAIVKVRRPGVRSRIDRDMRALTLAIRLALVVAPRLRHHRPVRIVQEIWTNLRKETDFRQEASNIQKFVEAFRGWETVNVPAVIDGLYAESVVIQEMSDGRRIDDPEVKEAGPRLAQVFMDAYLHQFFVVGLFHGDPHPGNLFVMSDGRLCFHDFGLVGYLDRLTRRNLAIFVQAFVGQNAAWVLDAAVDLGVLGGQMDRAEFVRGIEEILADYAARPMKEWSLAEAFMRVAHLGEGHNIAIPYNLLVLLRAMSLIESALRTLDPDLNVVDALIARGEETLQAVLHGGLPASATARLKSEAAGGVQDLPELAASWLHRTLREGGRPALTFKHEGLDSLETHLDRTGNRVALALVTLGLYIAASLLMQHSLGPRLFDGMPLFAAIGYGLALWFTFRLARGISRSGRL